MIVLQRVSATSIDGALATSLCSVARGGHFQRTMAALTSKLARREGSPDDFRRELMQVGDSGFMDKMSSAYRPVKMASAWSLAAAPTALTS